MTTLSRFALPALLGATLALAACHKECDIAPATGTGLAGRWQLSSRQCYCAPAPTPNETVTFTDTSYSFFKDGRPTTNGTYATASGAICGVTGPTPVLRLSPAIAPTIGIPPQTQNAIATLTGNTLVLDYGSPCDAPRDTYQRLP